MVQIILFILTVTPFFTCRFISHMVQIILGQFPCHIKTLLSFISHMVQIIPTKSTSSTVTHANLYFISHMVQIILIRISKYNSSQCNFISHMVQIILGYCLALKFASSLLLYIPHGSDNTRVLIGGAPYLMPFSLYPTWFR